MKKRFLAFILAATLVFAILPAYAAEVGTSNEKQYVLPYYDTYINISNVVSDNSNEYITTINIDDGMGESHQIEIVKDLYITATAPCIVTYGPGDQYVNYAKQLSDGSYTTDYDAGNINFDVEKFYLFEYVDRQNSDEIAIDTTKEVPNPYDYDYAVGGEGNYVILDEGVYSISNYHPSFRGAQGQSFADYNVILTVKGAPETLTATPTASKVLVNKEERAFEAYNIKGNNYFKLRDLAFVVNGTNKQFEVTWDGQKNSINLVSNKEYTSVGGEMAVNGNATSKNAVLSAAKFYVNGEEAVITAYNINGNNYFKLRDIAKTFNIGVTYDNATKTIGIDTSMDYKD